MTFLNAVIGTLWQIVLEIGLIFYESSVFILLGFALAGVLHEFVPMQLVARRLGQPGIKSIVWATLLGAPLPLCSCGVLPTAAALRRKGASKPAIASFIVSVPETGVDSIAVSYGLMGPIMAVFRPIVAVVTALVAGIACLFATRNERDDADDLDSLSELENHGHDHGHHHDHHHDHDLHQDKKSARRGERDRRSKHRRWQARMGRMAGYGFRTVLDEVAFWIVAGLIVTGILMALLPDDFFSAYLGLDSGLLPMLLMAVIGIPLYTCASMSTPIAAGLIATGLSPGAALVFLLAGPATSIASLTIVGKLLGHRSMVAYLASILTVAIAAGLLLDMFAADEIRSATISTFEAPDGQLEQAFKALCAMIFLGLFLDSLGRKSHQEPLRDIRRQGALVASGVRHVKRLSYGFAAILGVLLIIPLITLRVGPGQQGMIQRFGEVVARELEPGLYLHWPWPISTATLVDVSDIRQTYVSSATREFLTSDENVIALTSVIQYRVRDAFAFEFRGEKDVGLIRDLASRILVQEILSRPIDEIYTVQRSDVESAYRTKLAREILELGQGYELVSARLEHVHAPEQVHDAFRDVSSALEDRQRSKFDADGTAIATVNDARGRAAEMDSLAQAEARSGIVIAKGRAASFLPQARVFGEHTELSRLRLRLEAIENTLVRPRKYLNTVPGARGVDLWIDPEQEDVVKFNYRE